MLSQTHFITESETMFVPASHWLCWISIVLLVRNRVHKEGTTCWCLDGWTTWKHKTGALYYREKRCESRQCGCKTDNTHGNARLCQNLLLATLKDSRCVKLVVFSWCGEEEAACGFLSLGTIVEKRFPNSNQTVAAVCSPPGCILLVPCWMELKNHNYSAGWEELRACLRSWQNQPELQSHFFRLSEPQLSVCRLCVCWTWRQRLFVEAKINPSGEGGNAPGSDTTPVF